jgi:O-antigen/teichoic acid export membrane protein
VKDNFLLSRIKKHILSNLIGSGWTALISLVVIPIYIHFMGIEAYGLVGVFVSMQSLSVLLDMGLSRTLTRELARLSIRQNKSQETCDLVRTLEIINWTIAVFIGTIIILSAPLIAGYWLQLERITTVTARQAVVLIGFAIAFRWPANLYAAGLVGIQRQVLLNWIIITSTTLNGIGTVLILWIISPTVKAYFACQIVTNTIHTLLAAVFFKHHLPRTGESAVFQFGLLRRVWRFAAGMTGITATALIFLQVDKIILSRVLTLEMFGYYALAWSMAMGLYRLIGPVFNALYPRFTQLVASNDEKTLTHLYHLSCQFMSVLILPTAAMVVCFSDNILFLWTQSKTVVENTAPILSLLMIGTALNGMMNLPYALQFAYGWTRLAFYGNTVAALLLGPFVYMMATAYGGFGAAVAWIMLNIGYVLINVQLMHRRILPGEQWRWYREDILLPLLAVLMVAGTGRWFISEGMSQLQTATVLACVLITATVLALFAAPRVTARLIEKQKSVEFKMTE